MRPDRSYQDLASRLSRLVDGLLDEEEAAELEALLRSNPAARDYYRRYLATHLDLAGHFERDTIADRPSTPARPRRTALLLATAALLPLASGLGLWWMIKSTTPLPGPPPLITTAVSPGPVLAVTARTEGVLWSLPDSPAPGLKLRSGPARLDSGLLTIDLVGGQSMTLQAPAEFELLTETEMYLVSGDASFRMPEGGNRYIIRVPGGAVVDLGTEFSVNVAADGTADIHVFEGLANASVTGEGDHTREERLLGAGDSVRIDGRLETSPTEPGDFLRPIAPRVTGLSPAGDPYASRVARSGPLAWWRFEIPTSQSTVPDDAGIWPLTLFANPRISGSQGRRFLELDTDKAAGFAAPITSIPGLDTTSGITVECLLHSTSERYASAFTLANPAISPPRTGPLATHIRHAPHRLAIERMGRRGSKIGHVHPDFALRVLARSPADYVGGVNSYSTESHLLHRWVHVTYTNDGSHLRLYIDGRLSDEAPVALPFQNADIHPVIGRLQPFPQGEHRQWSGGIDEVALYDRALTAEAIRIHFEALER